MLKTKKSIQIVADTLVQKDHYDADKTHKRALNISGRRDANKERAIVQL